MKTLVVIALLAVPLRIASAQEIYKWVDEKGILHYGDRPTHPAAAPFKGETAPYSRVEEPLDTNTTAPGSSNVYEYPVEREPVQRSTKVPLPSPTLRQPKAWIDKTRGDFWIQGAVHNGGKGTCDSPAIEVTVIDEMGSVDGTFEVLAASKELSKGEDVQFMGKHFAPVGDKLTWEATPRCDSEMGALYGPRKRGSLKITHHRKLRLKTYKTK
ncbi:MAG: DUF4124 domain-containing protein [Candidatus Binatia bacterium]